MTDKKFRDVLDKVLGEALQRHEDSEAGLDTVPRCPVCAAFIGHGGGFKDGTCSSECARTTYLAYMFNELRESLDRFFPLIDLLAGRDR